MTRAPGAAASATWVLLAATFLWSTNYLLAFVLVDAMSSVQITFLRWALGLPLLIAAAAVIERPSWKTVARDWPLHVALGATGLVAYNLLNYEALRHTGPMNAAVVNAVNPAAIALLAAIVLGERLRRMQAAGIAVSLLGVLVVVGRGQASTLVSLDVNIGELLVLVAVVLWAVYAVLSRRLTTPPITATAAQAVVAVVVLAPVFVLDSPQGVTLAGVQWIWLALLVVFPTCVAFVLWNVGVARIGPGRAGIFINTMPVFTGIMSVILGVQVLHWSLVVGAAIVVIGVVMTAVRRRAVQSPSIAGSAAESTSASPPCISQDSSR